MRMPSDNLMQLLTDLQLCTARDIAGCEPGVRRLCHDLPDFDSVWLDALVQRRVLTPWQADVLQSGKPGRLQVDGFLLCDSIGTDTFLAESIVSRQRVVLKRIPDGENTEQIRSNLLDLLETLDECRQTAVESIELPRRVVTHEDGTVFVASRFVAGWTADQLLIRGGRIPPKTVAEVGLQLLQAMRWLESHRLVHGHIVLRNLRIQPTGQAKLVAPFVSRLMHPHISFNADLKLQDVESIAPELVATGADGDSQSELYAAGCVLWQMLTARPPFLSADPINRILKAKEKDIADVRTLVPDCPDWMARLIQSFTRRAPELRPTSVDEACSRWAKQATRSCTASRRLVKSLPDRGFQQRSIKTRQNSSGWLRPVLAATVMIAGFAGVGIYRGLLPMPLRLNPVATVAEDRPPEAMDQRPNGESQPIDDEPVHTADLAVRTDRGYLRMPSPDAAGVVVLESGHSYEATALQFPGVLHIESTGDRCAVVVVPSGEQWSISASQVILNHVQIQDLPETSDAKSAAQNNQHLVTCRCDVLSLRSCILRTVEKASCLHRESLSGATSVLSVQDCVISGNRYGLWLTEAVGRCEFRNTLFTSAGAALRYDIGAGGTVPVGIDLSSVTQVEGDAFLDVFYGSGRSSERPLEIRCGESVLAPNSAVIRLAGPPDWLPDRLRIAFLLPERGNPTIVPPNVNPVICFDRSLNQLVALPETQVITESLLFATPDFRGAATGAGHEFDRHQLMDYEGPKLSPRLPGIDVSVLPENVPLDSPYANHHHVSSARR